MAEKPLPPIQTGAEFAASRDPEAFARGRTAAHRCFVCGAPGHFGFGPPLRPDLVWTCRDHREAGEPTA